MDNIVKLEFNKDNEKINKSSQDTNITDQENLSYSNSMDEIGETIIGYRSDETAVEFFESLEAKHHSVLPEYLKNLIFLNGFGSLETFGSIQEEDLPEMERMCREEMSQYCPHTSEYFCFFSNCIQHFKIPIGHRKQLFRLIHSSKEEADNSTEEILEQKMPRRHAQESQDPLSVPLLVANIDCAEMANKIKQSIHGLLEKTNLQNCVEQDLQVNVHLGENDVVSSVYCRICSKFIKLSRDRRRGRKSGIPLISVSNFVGHIKRHHQNNEIGNFKEEDSTSSDGERKRRRTKEGEVLDFVDVKNESEEW